MTKVCEELQRSASKNVYPVKMIPTDKDGPDNEAHYICDVSQSTQNNFSWNIDV